MVKTIYWILHTKKKRSEKENGKGGKALNTLRNNAYGETMENLRNRINLKPVNDKKGYLKDILKPTYMLHKIFGNTLIVIRKNKHSLKLSKPAFIAMYVLVLSKVLM